MSLHVLEKGPFIVFSVLHTEDYLLRLLAEVETIVRNCNKEEIRRRMSHGELLRDFSGEAGTSGEQVKNERRAEEEKTTFFNAQVAKLQIQTDLALGRVLAIIIPVLLCTD